MEQRRVRVTIECTVSHELSTVPTVDIGVIATRLTAGGGLLLGPGLISAKEWSPRSVEDIDGHEIEEVKCNACRS